MDALAIAFLSLALLMMVSAIMSERNLQPYTTPSVPTIVVHSLAKRAGVRLSANVPYELRLARLRTLAKRFPEVQLVSEWAKLLNLPHVRPAQYIRDFRRAR